MEAGNLPLLRFSVESENGAVQNEICNPRLAARWPVARGVLESNKNNFRCETKQTETQSVSVVLRFNS
jgi:hypothetical protein